MNRRDTRSGKTFARRALILAGGQLALFSLLGARLYHLQVVEADRYRVLSDENRIDLRLLEPRRGRIVDRTGAELAMNRPNYCLVLAPEAAGAAERALDAVAPYAALDDDERRRVLREAARGRPSLPILVREHLTWREVAMIEVNAPRLPGLSIDERRTRHYPHGPALAHVLGYVAAVSEEEKRVSGDPLLSLPGFPVGKNGVEKIHDTALRGGAGSVRVEVDAHGRVVRELSRREGAAGRDVGLNIDLGLQAFAVRALGEEVASAVVMDVATGAVRALASTPAFDPNEFSRGMTNERWTELSRDTRWPLTNRAVSGRYPPGSVFKLAVALAALESGAVGAADKVFCPGRVKHGDRYYHCWKRHGHGAVDMVEAIAESCDVYFYDRALKIGIGRIAAMARRLGLGSPLGLDLPSEAGGLIPTPGWKEAMRDESWYPGDTIGAGIGQGYVLATPLQLAAMTARIADGARAVAPRLARGSDPDRPPPLGISATALDIVRKGMNEVVNDRRGTAWPARIEDAAQAMAGKTGTSQVRRISIAERASGVIANEDLPWEERDHALFAAYAPVDSPRLALSVVIEHGGSSKRAAKIARDILAEAQRRFPLPETQPAASV